MTLTIISELELRYLPVTASARVENLNSRQYW